MNPDSDPTKQIPVINSGPPMPVSASQPALPYFPQGPTSLQNSTWTKTIPLINNIFMGISLALVLLLDLSIAVKQPELRQFFYVMVGVLFVFGGFFAFESTYLKQRFAQSTSKLDGWWVALVVIRNLIFVLNFIPFIQILGLGLLVLGFLPFIIIYPIFILNHET